MLRKKLKNKILLLVLASVVLAGTGCKKYLEQTPNDSLTKENFFKTRADAIAAIVGVYDGLQACATTFLNWGEFRGDLVTATTNTDATYVYYQLLDRTRAASNWANVYNMIGRANIVIEAVPQIPALDSRFSVEESNSIVGEALFLRALGYFYLVRTFKEVPLVLQAPSNDNVTFRIPKSSADTVLNQVEADLLRAEQIIATTYTTVQETKGRATKGAVNALLTDVYMWRAKYQQAVVAAKKVINSGMYTLVPGANWFNIFSQKNTSESIIEVQYDYTLNETNSLKGTMAAFNMNNLLFDYFTGETDIIRGKNNTYVESGARLYWKYTGLNTNNIARPTEDPNFILYRLPDVMLMCAEAQSHLDGTQKIEAASLLDAVRARAGLLSVNADSTTSSGLFTEYIMKERAMELGGEGKRWFDLVRVATNNNNPDFLVNRVVQSRSVGERAQTRARIIDPRSWYSPIYLDELNRNPALIQNPYYQ